MSILLIAGSPTPASRTTRLLDVASEWLESRGESVTTLIARELPAAALLDPTDANHDVQAALASIENADAIVIATPIYKAAYTGLLKALLDRLPQSGLRGKTVLPIACGGSAAHMLAIDYALRPVLSALAAEFVLPGIYAVDAQVQWTAANQVKLDAELERRLSDGLHALVRARRHRAPTSSAVSIEASHLQSLAA